MKSVKKRNLPCSLKLRLSDSDFEIVYSIIRILRPPTLSLFCRKKRNLPCSLKLRLSDSDFEIVYSIRVHDRILRPPTLALCAAELTLLSQPMPSVKKEKFTL